MSIDDQAQKRMNAKNYYGAIESLEAIENRYPFGKYAEQAQVELIYAHFMNSETEASVGNSISKGLIIGFPTPLSKIVESYI